MSIVVLGIDLGVSLSKSDAPLPVRQVTPLGRPVKSAI
jgi:hypothetical protein